jgi:ribosomal protein L27
MRIWVGEGKERSFFAKMHKVIKFCKKICTKGRQANKVQEGRIDG